EKILDLVVTVMRTEVRTDLAVWYFWLARIVPKLIPRKQSPAKTSSCVTGGRLQPDVLERALTLNQAICNAIQSHTARHAQVFHPSFFMDMPDDTHHHVFSYLLDASRDVHMKLGQF